jgi:predicted GIY-YIG superfamily endonuclease
VALGLPVNAETNCVYIMKSDRHPDRFYTGLTSDISARLAAHNAGLSSHTASGRPWRLIVSVNFESESRAEDFEQYLKSGSGQAFAVRHFR